MKKNLLLLLFLSIAFYTNAQLPDDALRNEWFIPNGSARNIAIGGAGGSLGGDISSNHINPAGIGLYKTKEIVLSPGFALNNNKFNYRGDNTAANKSNFNLGTSGIVIGFGSSTDDKFKSAAFSFSVNQMSNYNNHIYYKGLNNQSSFSEQYLEELTRDGASPQAAEQNYIFGSSLAYRTYLIDSFNDNGVFKGYKSLVPVGTGIIQEKDETITGSYTELSLALAGNIEDKLYIGASLNFPIVNYKSNLTYKEKDATSDPDNNFSDFTFTQNFISRGIGINAKLGLIYKPQESIRLGIALHTPSFIGFKDEIRAALTTNTEGYAGTLSESSNNLNSGNPGERDYNLQTAWRILGSASYVFKEVADTKKQKGFITADIEYVNYASARFTQQNVPEGYANDYYNSLNNVVKDYYKGNINIRLGGELKFNVLAVRLGAAYYGSPYSDAQLKANKLMFAGGFGYRNHGVFIDVTYSYTANKDVNFPYRLNDVPNTFAIWKNNRGMALLTVGFKI